MRLIRQPTILVEVIVLLSIVTLVYSTSAESHLSYASEYAHPGYAFSYGVKDLHTGDVKSQWESRDGGVIKGHYSVLEPDGSIRTVDYTADSENGFNAVVKTHGPNIHPVTDAPHSVAFDDTSSQSKINHYGKDQEHIVLSSDIEVTKKPFEDLTNSHQSIPTLIEIKPNVDVRPKPKPVIEYELIKPSQEEHFYPSEIVRPEIKSVPAPDLSKYQKISPYVEFKNSDNDWKATVHDEPIGIEYYKDKRENEFFPKAKINKIPENFVRKPNHNGLRTDFVPSKPISLEGRHQNNFVKKGVKPFQTPGLKHFATFPKNFHPNGHHNKPADYSRYFRRTPKEGKFNDEGPVLFPEDTSEQRAASTRIVQSMMKRDKKFMAPSYARYNTNFYYN